MKQILQTIVKAKIVLVALAVFVVVGCNPRPAEPEAMGGPERVEQMVEMRQLYDKARGNWDALSAEDKAEFERLAGSPGQRESIWNMMAGPPGGTPR